MPQLILRPLCFLWRLVGFRLGARGQRLWVMGYGLWVMGYGLWTRSPAFGCRFPIFYFLNFFFSAASFSRFCAPCAFFGGS